MNTQTQEPEQVEQKGRDMRNRVFIHKVSTCSSCKDIRAMLLQGKCQIGTKWLAFPPDNLKIWSEHRCNVCGTLVVVKSEVDHDTPQK